LSQPGRHLILGWPRGGLGYVTQLLRRHGQDVGLGFDHTTSYSNLAIRYGQSRAYEVSTALAPFLSHPDLREAQVSFVVRDPMRVLNSLYFHGLFHCERPSHPLELACRHLPGFREQYWGKPTQAIVAFLAGWYALVEAKYPQLQFVRVESGNLLLLRRLIGKEKLTVPYCPPDINASFCKQVITPSQLPPASAKLMRGMLHRFGYLDSVWNPRGGHAHYINPDWHS